MIFRKKGCCGVPQEGQCKWEQEQNLLNLQTKTLVKFTERKGMGTQSVAIRSAGWVGFLGCWKTIGILETESGRYGQKGTPW